MITDAFMLMGVGGDNMARALHHLRHPGTIKSRMETFWYWLTQVDLENGR